MNRIYTSLILLLNVCLLSAQTFTQNTSLIPSTYNSGGCTGVTDMNNDGLDDIVILDESKNLSIAYQQVNGSFSISYFGTVSNQNQWGMCIGDIDNDGHKDVMCGGAYDDAHMLNIDGPGIYTQSDYPWASIFMQGSNFTDINNDGFLDGFACNGDGHNVVLLNNGTGSFTNGTSIIDMTFYPEVGGNDNSGNYGSVWTDFDRDGDTDLFITKCRQFISDPYDPRRTNVLVINNGDGTYDHTNPITGIPFAQERGLVNLEQSWTSDFADIDNDGDFDCLITTHSNTLEIYENNGSGFFTDRTQGSGLQYSGFYLQGKLHDFDNDGFVDLIHAGGTHDFYRNNGNFTFTRIENMFVNNDVMHSFAIGDLNDDGYLDVYASYGDGYVDADNGHPDRIFLNNGGTNNWIAFDLEGITSNNDATGAIVEITGSFGTQLREVRSGESYGITNTATCYFGLGTATSVDAVVIYWPSGLETNLLNPTINFRHRQAESPCFLASPTITPAGPTQFCEGGSVILQATSSALTFLWNTGESGPSITVSEPGNYYAIATTSEGCIAISNSIPVGYTQTPIAEIFSDELIELCAGDNIVLAANTGNSYSWSNGATSQSVTIASSGTYSVQVTTACGTATSSPVEIVTIDPPVAPNVMNATTPVNYSAILVSTGNENTNWYLNENDNSPLATGSTFQTPPLSQSTSYWVETFNTGAQASFFGGNSFWLLNGDGQYQPVSTYYLLFDVHEDAVIRTVKVYAQGSADRTIAVVDNAGVTIAEATLAIPDGESIVELNFFVPEGTGYGLRCIGNNPLLWRDKNLSVPFAYPFNIGDLITITNTNISGADTDNYYYYFYEWNVEREVTYCYSAREEVEVQVSNEQPIEGCTAPTACNYNPTANVDNGQCTFPGCTNPQAINYDISAGCSDTSCICNEELVIFEDNFENYFNNQGISSQSNVWDTWDGSSLSDAAISLDFAYSGNKSVKIQGNFDDLVLPIGPYSTGSYEINFRMLVTSSGGYFSLLHQWSPTEIAYEWAADFFFDSEGNITWILGGISGGQGSVPLYEWFDVTILADLNNDFGSISMNDVTLSTWQWSLNNANGAPGLNAIAGINFYGTNTSLSDGLYYVDELVVSSVFLVDCNESGGCNQPGCTDVSACNYSSFAECEDGSCYYSPVISEVIVPNGDFENWNTGQGYLEPTGWATLNLFSALFGGLSSVSQGSAGFSGNYSAELVTTSIDGSIYPSFAYIGETDLNGGGNDGFPLNSIPNMLTGHFKSNIIGDDLAAGFVFLTKYNFEQQRIDTVASGSISFPSSESDWTLFTIAIDTLLDITPDTCHIVFAISLGNNPVLGSALSIDNISFNQPCIISGCTDPAACNFDFQAEIDDESCVYPGCTNAAACNYNFTAGCDNGSCLFTGTTCNDNNAGTMLDQVNANCNCQGTPFNYGAIATTTTNLCPGVAPQTINLSAPLNLQSYAVQWYYRDGANSCPSGNSTAGWNILSGENGLTYTPTEFIGTRTYACFISPSGIYGIPAAWANGCRTISYYSFDAQAVIGNPNIAPFSTVTYAVNPIAGHTFNWAVTNGAITSGQGTSVITILWGQNGPYQVTLTESNGICSDVSSLLVVNSNCSISVSAIAEGGNSFCPGSSTTLQALSDATGITYQWFYNGSEILGAIDASVEITSGGNYQVLITQAACTAVSQTLFITTLPAVVVPQLTITSDTPGCSGGTVIISAEGGTFDTYVWSNGATASTIEVSTSGDYSVDLTDANGCHATAGPVSVNLALQEPLPICIVTVDAATNNNIVVWEPLESDVTSGYSIYKETNIADEYVSIGSVNYGSDGIFTDLNSNASVQASRYKLALIDTCGIESFLTPQHKTIHLTSNLGLNNTVNLIWSNYEGFFFGSYNIYRGDAANNLTLLTTIASNLNSYTDLNPLAGPTFYVIEVEGISCDPTRDVVLSRSNVIQLDANAVMEKPAAHCFLWPNPGNDIFNLRVDQTLLGSAWLVRTMLGQEIASFQTPSTVYTIDASNWAPGVYLLENKNTSSTVLRIVKE